jgi:hypothetical protein
MNFECTIGFDKGSDSKFSIKKSQAQLNQLNNQNQPNKESTLMPPPFN